MREDSTRYTPWTFLKSKALFCAIMLAFTVFVTVALHILTVTPSGIAVVDGAALLCAVFYLVFTYSREVTFWRSMEEAARTIEKSAYVVDLLEEPSFTEGKIAHEMALAIANSDNLEITDLKERVRSNAEYIELWVHEAKTPLAAAKLITRRMTGADALSLRRELERMDDLIGQALFAARTDSLVQDYLIREVNLAEVAKEACKSHMHYLTSLDVALDIQIDPAITVFADKTWLEFIIVQIVINAAKYDATTISFTAFESEQETSASCTILEIKDNGCGIPASDVPRVFDRGFTGEVGREHGSATGMGLYLVARMCASMGLSVMLASEEGIGTRVQISFPHDRRRAQVQTRGLARAD